MREAAAPVRLDEPAFHSAETAPTPKGLKCLSCGGVLQPDTNRIKCPACGAHWPLVGGVPRFFNTDGYYWGEISRDDATDLLADARKRGWEEAVLADVKSSNLRRYYTNLQRTSWLALLDLDPSATALDVGSGYGAITHSLALSLGYVYSVEAVPERAEFTYERLRQEDVGNVSVIQASALDLPFFDKTFDLIVVNGVLEWIGEWDADGTPRAAQLRFLSKLHRLLKDSGSLVIGIENRFGFHAFQGQLDHSGMPYTSLVPRWLATPMLRRCKRDRYAFLKPNSRKVYRTYTYSSRGYRKLLNEAAFSQAAIYCADPGYNQPNSLVPLDRRHPAHVLYRQMQARHDTEHRTTWKGRVKNALKQLHPLFANEFVIVAQKGVQTAADPRHGVIGAVAGGAKDHKGAPAHRLSYSVQTRPYSNQSVLEGWDPEARKTVSLAKVSVREPSRQAIGHVTIQFQKLSQASDLLAQHPDLGLSAPRPEGLWREGRMAWTLETYATGKPFILQVNRQRYAGNARAIRADFARLIGAGVDLTKVLQTLSNIPMISSAWYQLPQELEEDASFREKASRARYFSESGSGGKEAWIQHGDFVPQNIFENPKGFEIIDWNSLAGGFPPLYDIFTLIIQPRLLMFFSRKPLSLDWEDRAFRSFSNIFLEKSEMAAIFEDLLGAACQRLNLTTELIPSLLTEYLIIRINYNQMRRESTAPGVRMLRAWIER